METGRTSQFDWDHVRAFLAVADLGSLSAAARHLRLTHATVARRIADLEHRLGGVPLFEKSRTGYVPTQAAERALAPAKAMLLAADAFGREVIHADEMAGSVSVSGTATVVDRLIAPALMRLVSRYPDLQVEVESNDRNISLSRREADVAVRLGRPGSGEAIGRKVGAITYRLFGTSDYLRSTKPAARRVLGFSEPLRSQAAPKRLGDLIRGIEAGLTLPSFTAQAAAAKTGSALAFLPEFLAIDFDGLVAVDDPAISWTQDVWLLTHTDARRFRRVQVVAEAIAAAFS